MRRRFAAMLLAGLLALTGCSGGIPTLPIVTSQPSPAASETLTLFPTREPSPSPAPTPAYASLQEDETGEAATAAQERLADLGYLSQEDITGVWDEAARYAAGLFTRQNGGDPGSASFQAALFATDAPRCAYPLAGIVIGLDPGHQAQANSEQEPIAPGSSITKKKVSSGTQGTWSGVPEYQVNLDVALLLRDLLIDRGARVVMTRETHDVDISNAQRAQFMNEAKTDYALRLHCNGSTNEEIRGAFALTPVSNPFQAACEEAAEILIEAYCGVTGAKNLGVTPRSDQTGFNWCERLILTIEMGHMTNREEDGLLTDPAYQAKMAEGLCEGISAFFRGKEPDSE